MSLSSAVLDALIASGCTREQLAAAMRADIAEREAAAEEMRQAEAAKIEKKREGNRARQQRKREHDRNAESRVTAVTARDKRDRPPSGSPKDINQTPSLPPAKVSEAEASSPLPRAWALPSGVSLQVWQDFLKNRKRKSLSNTETAWKGFCDDLARVAAQTGIPPPKLIEHAAAKGWGSINDPNERNQRHERPDTNPTGTALSRVHDALRSGGAFN